jgi:hypothetical protein
MPDTNMLGVIKKTDPEFKKKIQIQYEKMVFKSIKKNY